MPPLTFRLSILVFLFLGWTLVSQIKTIQPHPPPGLLNSFLFIKCREYILIERLTEWLKCFSYKKEFESLKVSQAESQVIKKKCPHRGGSRGRVQGVRTPLPWDEEFSFVIALKICLPHTHRSVTSLVRGTPRPKKKSWIRPYHTI